MTRETPDEWHLGSLGEITESAVDGPFGSNLKTEHYVSEPGIRVIRLQNIGNGEFNSTDKAWVSEVHARALGRHDVRAGDVLVASLGDENHPFARACLYPSDYAPGIVKADCFRLRTAKDRASPGFIMRSLNCASLRSGLRGRAQGVTRDRVNLGNLLRYRIPMPPVGEQKRVSEILDAVDEAIRQSEQLIAKLKQMKQGLLHDLLTRGINDNGELRDPERHPGQFQGSPLGLIPKQWRADSLKVVLEGIDAGKSPDCPDRPAPPGEWGVLKVSAVRHEGFVPRENKVLLRPSLANPSHEVRDGDLLITRANTYELVGLTCLVEHPPPRLLLCDKTLRLRLCPEAAPSYIFFASQMPYVRRQIEIHATGSSGSMKNISQNAIRNLMFMLPPWAEQNRIVERTRAVDGRIKDEMAESQKLRLLKQGLMEDLLTGRVRVTNLDAAR